MILADFVCTFVTVVVDIVQKDCVYGQFFGILVLWIKFYCKNWLIYGVWLADYPLDCWLYRA